MLLLITLKLFTGLLGLLLVVRLLGKKSLSALTPFDLIYTLVLGGILEEALYDDQVNIGHLLVALALWGCLIYIIERLVQKNDRINRWLKGEPAVLVRNGMFNLAEMKRSKVEFEQLRELARQQQCFSLANVKHQHFTAFH